MPLKVLTLVMKWCYELLWFARILHMSLKMTLTKWHTQSG